MSAVSPLRLISVEEYLAGELVSTVKHEYLAGTVYAMAGGTNAHNLVATNILVALGSRLRGTGCRPYNSDTKIRIPSPREVRFYYPDVSVVCHPNPPTDSFQDRPVAVVEVVSAGTRRVDEGEKKDAYFALPTLSVYLVVEQHAPAVVAHRRTLEGIVREEYVADAVIPLPEIGVQLPLAEVFDGVEFIPPE